MSSISEYVKDLQRFMQKAIRCEFFSMENVHSGEIG